MFRRDAHGLGDALHIAEPLMGGQPLGHRHQPVRCVVPPEGLDDRVLVGRIQAPPEVLGEFERSPTSCSDIPLGVPPLKSLSGDHAATG